MSVTYNGYAQGAYWELAIAVPIQNPKFRLPSMWSSTLDGATVAGAVSLVINGTDAIPRLIYGDVIVVGPSTDATNLGATETIIGGGTATTEISLASATKYEYADGDPVSGYGHGRAGGWDEYGDWRILDEASLIRPSYNSTSPWTHGAENDWYGQKVTVESGNGTYAGVRQTVPQFRYPKEVYDSSAKWRQGVYYKFTPPSAGTGSVVMATAAIDGSAAENSHSTAIITASGTAVSTYSHVIDDNFSFTKIGEIRTTLYAENVSGNYADASWYSPFVEFELPYGGGVGCYTFAKYPEWGSVEAELRSLPGTTIRVNNTLAISSPDGWDYRNDKWTISAEFLNVSQAMWNMLRRYENFQDRGYLLNLHCYLNDVPWVLTGHLTLVNPSKASTFLAAHSFGLVFEEA